MAQILPCLLRVDNNANKYKVFKLDKKEVTIGRSNEVTYAIASSMISRCHAIVKQQEDQSWSITDNKSVNGIYVNGDQLSPIIPYILQDQDMVQFGVPASPNVPAKFIYKFYSSLKVRIEKKTKKLKTEPSELEKATLSFSDSSQQEEERDKKRKIPGNQDKKIADSDDSLNKILLKTMEGSKQEQSARETEYLSRLAEMERLLKEKEQKHLEVQQQLDCERQEKENQAKEMEELRLKEMTILIEMDDKQKQLEKDKEEMKLQMQEELERSLKERERVLLTQLTAQKDVLISEKKQVEKILHREMTKALEEKDKELEKNLLEQKGKLEKVLEKKEIEQKFLETQLNETKEKSEIHALKAKEEILSNFADLMEMELQCSICNELFIQATSLSCSHTFCKLCINQWLKVKKECPNCRTAVLSQMQAIALDSYIDKMVDQLSDELKERRKELVILRKAEQDKFDGHVPGPSNAAPVTYHTPAALTINRRSTRPNRGQNSRSARRAASATPGQAATVVLREAANISSAGAPSSTVETTEYRVIEIIDDSNDEEEDSVSVGGDSHAYYGRCFKCGMHGHWANRCPH